MSSRDDILGRVRRNQPAAQPLPEVPPFGSAPTAPLEAFKAALERMGGKFAAVADRSEVAALVRAWFPDARVVCSATPEVAGNRALEHVRAPGELDDVDVGVVRAGFGVAETGSVWLTEADFKVSALGFLSQHLVVLLDPAAIVTNLHHAYTRERDFDVGYGVFLTGPSATADIEGVLIHGAQGVRSLTVIAVA